MYVFCPRNNTVFIGMSQNIKKELGFLYEKVQHLRLFPVPVHPPEGGRKFLRILSKNFIKEFYQRILSKNFIKEFYQRIL
jgi:hypothetical protein